jgi:hypothetical protein
VGAEWTDTERRAPVITEELTYGGMRAPDGADISSRRKYRDYLKATGTAPISDFKETTAKARAQRESRSSERAAIRETVGRTLYQLSTQRKK